MDFLLFRLELPNIINLNVLQTTESVNQLSLQFFDQIFYIYSNKMRKEEYLWGETKSLLEPCQ